MINFGTFLMGNLFSFGLLTWPSVTPHGAHTCARRGRRLINIHKRGLTIPYILQCSRQNFLQRRHTGPGVHRRTPKAPARQGPGAEPRWGKLLHFGLFRRLIVSVFRGISVMRWYIFPALLAPYVFRRFRLSQNCCCFRNLTDLCLQTRKLLTCNQRFTIYSKFQHFSEGKLVFFRPFAVTSPRRAPHVQVKWI